MVIFKLQFISAYFGFLFVGVYPLLDVFVQKIRHIGIILSSRLGKNRKFRGTEEQNSIRKKRKSISTHANNADTTSWN